MLRSTPRTRDESGQNDDRRGVAEDVIAVLVVDGANVVGSRPTGWWRDRPGAARELVARIRAATRDGGIDAPVVVVLEGKARHGAPEETLDGVEVVHARGE